MPIKPPSRACANENENHRKRPCMPLRGTGAQMLKKGRPWQRSHTIFLKFEQSSYYFTSIKTFKAIRVANVLNVQKL